MALNVSNNYLNTLVNTGADAYNNLYEAVFEFQTNSPAKALNASALAPLLTVRCTGFTIPQQKQDSYDVKFVTASIPRPRAKVDVTRQFNVSFRVDANYLLYKNLLKQKGVTSNMSKSFVTNDIYSLSNHATGTEASKLFNVTINVVDNALTGNEQSDISAVKMFRFENCWITKIDELPFKQESSDPMTVSLEVHFLEMYDLESGFTATDSRTDTDGLSV